MSRDATKQPTDQNGNKLRIKLRRDPDGTWSRNVWFGWVSATTPRRYYGYQTRAEAQHGNISELPRGGRIGEYEA